MKSRRARQPYRSNWQLPRLRPIRGSLSMRVKLSPRLKSWRNQSKMGGGGGLYERRREREGVRKIVAREERERKSDRE